MATIGFIGLGNMGKPMAHNLIKAGHTLKVHDVAASAMETVVKAGATAAASAAEATRGVEAVVTMLPAGPQLREVYLGAGKAIASAAKGTLLIDCTTADVTTSRLVHEAAAAAGHDMVDSPVSGGVAGAEVATLTMMVGGPDRAVERARPILAAMGRNIVHAGGPGNGQAAKMCNNMMLGIQMISVCEAFLLAEKVGLDPQKLFEVSSTASGQCWSLTSYCPVPGPVPNSPANRGYKPGFTAAMMLKDLKLSQEAAQSFGVATPLGAAATALYQMFSRAGGDTIDFSGIIRMLSGERSG